MEYEVGTVLEGKVTSITKFGAFVALEGGKGEQYPLLLGSGYFIPGFEEHLAGAAVGE